MQQIQTGMRSFFSSCDAIGAPLEEPDLDAPSQKLAPGAITTRTLMLSEFITAQHIKHGIIDENGVLLKSSKQKPSVTSKEGCAKLNDGCIPGYPHYDPQGMVCGNDDRSDEAYCKYSEGPNACVIGCRDSSNNDFRMSRNSQMTSTVTLGWGRSKEVGVTATIGSIALGNSNASSWKADSVLLFVCSHISLYPASNLRCGHFDWVWACREHSIYKRWAHL